MKQELIDTYGLVFINKEIDFGSRTENVKIADSDKPLIGSLLTDLPFLEDAEYVLNSIEEAIARPDAEIEDGSEIYLVEMHQHKAVIVDLYAEDWPDTNFALPVDDIKQIVEAWRDFLKQEPLNGSVVE